MLINFIDEDFKPIELATREALVTARKNYDQLRVMGKKVDFLGLDSK